MSATTDPLANAQATDPLDRPERFAAESTSLDPNEPDSADDDEASTTDWLVTPPKVLRVRPLTFGLMLAAILTLGALLGTTLEKHHVVPTSSSGRTGTANGATGSPGPEFGAQGGFPSQASTANGTGSTTSGTVKSVDSTDLVMTTTAGKTVTVRLSSATLITRVSHSTSQAVQVGDHVTVTATKSATTLVASAVTATASGVTATSGFAAPPGAGPTGA